MSVYTFEIDDKGKIRVFDKFSKREIKDEDEVQAALSVLEQAIDCCHGVATDMPPLVRDPFIGLLVAK